MAIIKPFAPAPVKLTADAPRVCVSYNRKSNSKGLDQRFNSIDAQEARAEEFVKGQVTWKWGGQTHYSDGGRSGATLNRPAFKKLLADARAGKFNTVVVYKLDRLARNLLAFADIDRYFKPLGVEFVFVTEQFSDDPNGRLQRNIKMSFAEYERDLGIERTTDKIAGTRKKGLWSGGQLPLGYDRIDRRLVVNPWEAKIVRDMFALYLQLRSTGAVARELRNRGYKTKERKFKTGVRAARTWTKAAVLGILRNPIYVGQIPHHEQVFKGEHEAIISREQFDEVAALLKRNAVAGESHGENPNYFLRGVLRCATRTIDGTRCHHALAPASTRRGNKEFRYYQCVGRQKLGREVCPSKGLPANAIETFVVDQIRAASADREFMDRIRACLASIGAYRERVATVRARLDAELVAIAADERTAADSMIRAEGPARDVYEREINRLGQLRTQTERRAHTLAQHDETLSEAAREGEWIVSQLASFSAAWCVLSPENRARLVDGVVDEVHVSEQEQVIEIVFSPLGRELPSFDDGADLSELGAPPEPLREVLRESLFRVKSTAHKFTPQAPVVRLPVKRAAKVARMLALAHHIDRAIKGGRFADRATVARHLELTRARMTHVLNLLHLAPDLQERILFLESVDGVEPLAERALRPVIAAGTWSRQRQVWERTIAPLLGSKGGA
jgi:DNA invertase Pin-like site-specific DNA recombinase